MQRGLVVILALLLLPWTLPAWSATRLGVWVTAEELAVWQTRMGSGPYRVAGDVSTNSPGDWTRIVADKNTFVANPAAQRWAGRTTSPCMTVGVNPGGIVTQTPFAGVPLVGAAFYSLVAQDATVRTAVINELLAQAALPGVDFTNATRWCQNYGGVTADYIWPTIVWLGRLATGYSYIRHLASAGERTTLDSWFVNAATWAVGENSYELRNNYFPNYESDNYTLGGAAQGYCGEQGPLTHYGGYVTHPITTSFNNRRVDSPYLAGVVGAMVGNSPLTARAKKQVKEHLMFGYYADSTPSEFERWEDAPTQGWRYAAYTVGVLGLIADMQARMGDAELYNYSTSSGFPCGTNPTTGGPKSIQTITNHILQYVVPDLIRYGTNQAGQNGQANYRIDTVEDLFGHATVVDVYMAAANRWYQQAAWTARYKRTAGGAPAYPANPAYPGDQLWRGPFAKFGGMLFQFEGVAVNPYGTSVAPVVTITAPASGPTYTTATSPLTTLAGTASDDGTWTVSVACVPSCGTPTVTNATGSPWSVASLPLTAGDNVITVTITDNDTQVQTATLTVTYQSTADITTGLELLYTFDEAASGTVAAQDGTGHGHLGTFAGSTTRTGGHSSSLGSALFDGAVGGGITATGLLGEPAGMTVAAWVKLAGTLSTNRDVVSLGDHVALRLTSTTLIGFHFTGGSTWDNLSQTWAGDTNWHHLGYTVKAGAQALYLDGVQIAYDSAALAPNYAGLGQQLVLGAHGNGETGKELSGQLDTVRIYSRALSSVDMAALASPSTPPTCTVTTPADDPFETDTTPLATFAGTAMDDVAVDHITWTNSLGGGGAASGTESWTVANVPLLSGSQVLTATAHDGDGQTGTCSITVDYTPPPPSAGMGIYTGFTGANVLRRR
jgi:hypothetical protein